MQTELRCDICGKVTGEWRDAEGKLVEDDQLKRLGWFARRCVECITQPDYDKLFGTR